ncbi:MAG: hypothetical protein KA161_07705 [Saprospiraceae bacterium]|nr:hypothetical protein [Saprospiraceae bacterium]
MMENIKLQTLLSLDRLANLIRYNELIKELEGDVAEFGVFRGGSLELLAQLNPGKTVWGIDSFEGLPAPTDKDNYHKEGDFKEVEYENIKGYFGTMYRNVNLLKGFSPAIFLNIDPFKKFCFVHIDVDLYQSVKDGLDYFYPRMVDGGVIILDDYGWESTEGAKKATDEFAAEINPNFFGELFYYGNGETSFACRNQQPNSHKQFLIIK